MKVHELKEKIAQLRDKMKEREPKILRTSKEGPIGITPVEWVAKVLEDLQKQIDELKQNQNRAQ